MKHAKHAKNIHKHSGGGGGMVYLLGFVGAVIFYIQQATNFWEGLLGVGKAILWPAFLVYKALVSLQM